MTATLYFGYALIAVSAMLLAQHRHLWLHQAPALQPADRAFVRRQLQRRIVASALIGVVGAAMTLIERVPRTPLALSAYLFALLLAVLVILAIAVVDLAASRLRRDNERYALLAEQLKEKLISSRADR